MPKTRSVDTAGWTKRQERVTELAERTPWAKEVLGFYGRIVEFQRGIYNRAQLAPSAKLASGSGLRSLLNLEDAANQFAALAAVVRKNGPPKLAEDATRLRGESSPLICGMLEQWLSLPELSQNGISFFARVLLEPQAEWLARTGVCKPHPLAENVCPICQSRPQLAIIRREGDGGKRSLLCSLCQWEWEFRRIVCPACGEEHNEKLPRYRAEGIASVRVEACDSCKQYLKSVDLTVDGLAVPAVDEIATAPLDLWAVERDYRKIQINIMGF